MWRKFTIPLIIAGLAWLSVQWQRDQQAAEPGDAALARQETPDAYMEGVVSRRMDANGRPGHEMRTTRATHYRQGDRTEFEAPFITIYRTDGSLWTVAAEQGLATGGNDEVLLSGEVIMRRPLDPAQPTGAAELEVFTRELRILNDQEFAETDQPTTIVYRYGQVDAVGMKVWFKQERLQLLSQVNGVYETTH